MTGGGSPLAAPSWSQGTHPPTPASLWVGSVRLVLGVLFWDVVMGLSGSASGSGREAGLWVLEMSQGAGDESAGVQAWVRWV